MKPRMPAVSPNDVRRFLDYDPETGVFTRRAATNPFTPKRFIGKSAGFVHHTGYQIIKINSRAYFAQRVAWAHYYGEWPEVDVFIDHINRDKLDNRIANLRKATHGQNAANSKVRALSGHKGVYPDRRCGLKWNVSISVDGKKKTIGTFKELSDAARAYEMAAKEQYGEFANFKSVSE